jgi:hypothetical protein
MEEQTMYILLIFVFTLIAVSLLAAIAWRLWKTMGSAAVAPSPAVAYATAVETQQRPTEARPGNWCLVAEDTQGRWCVNVPTGYACDPLRTFRDRETCEMTDASSMPLGIVRNQGALMSPLFNPKAAMANTF